MHGWNQARQEILEMAVNDEGLILRIAILFVFPTTRSMSGMTSQPSMGALVMHYLGSRNDFGVRPEDLAEINEYWESVRQMYSPFGA